MAKPDITAILGTTPYTPVRGEVLWSWVKDEEFDQFLWRAEVLIERGFEPIPTFGFFTEFVNSPRSSKEALLIIRVLDAGSPGGDPSLGGVGVTGVEELEFGEDFVDVIRVTQLVPYGFTPPSSYTYRSVAYSYLDHELRNVDTLHKKAVVIYKKVSNDRTKDRALIGQFGGAYAEVDRTVSLIEPSVPTLTSNDVSFEVKQTKEGYFVSQRVYITGSWPQLNAAAMGELDEVVTQSETVVPKGSAQSGVISLDLTHLIVGSVEPIDFLREKQVVRTEPLTGPELDTSVYDDGLELTETKQVVKEGTVTPSSSFVGGFLNEVMFEAVDRWRTLKRTISRKINWTRDATRLGENGVDSVSEEYGVASGSSSANISGQNLVITTYDKPHPLYHTKTIETRGLQSQLLYFADYDESLGAFITGTRQLVARTTGSNTRVVGASDVTITTYNDVNNWQTEVRTQVIPLGGLSGSGFARYKEFDTFIELDLPPTVTGVRSHQVQSTLGVEAKYHLDVAFDLTQTSKRWAAKVRRYFVNSLSDVATVMGSLSMLEYEIKTKEILVGYAYWGGNSGIQTIKTPSAFWNLSSPVTITPSATKHSVLINNAASFTFQNGDFTAAPSGQKCVRVTTPQEWKHGMYTFDVYLVTF